MGNAPDPGWPSDDPVGAGLQRLGFEEVTEGAELLGTEAHGDGGPFGFTLADGLFGAHEGHSGIVPLDEPGIGEDHAAGVEVVVPGAPFAVVGHRGQEHEVGGGAEQVAAFDGERPEGGFEDSASFHVLFALDQQDGEVQAAQRGQGMGGGLHLGLGFAELGFGAFEVAAHAGRVREAAGTFGGGPTGTQLKKTLSAILKLFAGFCGEPLLQGDPAKDEVGGGHAEFITKALQNLAAFPGAAGGQGQFTPVGAAARILQKNSGFEALIGTFTCEAAGGDQLIEGLGEPTPAAQQFGMDALNLGQHPGPTMAAGGLFGPSDLLFQGRDFTIIPFDFEAKDLAKAPEFVGWGDLEGGERALPVGEQAAGRGGLATAQAFAGTFEQHAQGGHGGAAQEQVAAKAFCKAAGAGAGAFEEGHGGAVVGARTAPTGGAGEQGFVQEHVGEGKAAGFGGDQAGGGEAFPEACAGLGGADGADPLPFGLIDLGAQGGGDLQGDGLFRTKTLKNALGAVGPDLFEARGEFDGHVRV